MHTHTHTHTHTQAFYDDLASRSYVEDISTLMRGPTPAGVLNELAQKKVLPPFVMEFEGEGVCVCVYEYMRVY